MKKRMLNRFRELLAIKARREGRNISQRQAAEEMGVAKTTVDRYARNEVSRYDEPIVLAMCEYLNVGISELLVIEEVIENPDMPGQTKTLLAAMI